MNTPMSDSVGGATLKEAPSTFNLVMSVVLLAVLPALVYYMWIAATQYDGALPLPATKEEWLRLWSYVPAPTWTAVAIFAGWYAFQGLLQIYAPGPWVDGSQLADGSRLKYKMNGWFSWWFTWAMIAALVFRKGVSLEAIKDAGEFVYAQFGPVLTTIQIFTFLFSLYLYFYGKWKPAGERQTGYAMYDYWLGTALNPRIGNFDLKLFCEARPGLISWVAINLFLAAKQYQLHGTITTPMILVCGFHFWYIADYYYHEEAILTTWDIRHENFGWMLCWGDLVWVPFTYTLQAFYLLNHTDDLPWWATAGIVALNFAGYYIFRSVNIQKHRFRTNPEGLIWGKKPEYIRTARGTLLLTSGWWGVARHLNYLGDLMMGLAWCLPTGFDHPLPYFYITYFTILLVHREMRDNKMCAKRYGADWDAYTAKVKWRILPGIY